MWRNLAVVLLAQACVEYQPVGDVDVVGTPNPRPLETPVRTDRIVQSTVTEVDVLWVVDNSGSMGEEQELLAENFPRFMDFFLGSGLDYHIGVVSTDMESPFDAGRLRDAAGYRWIDDETIEPSRVFSAMAVMGTDGSGDERGLDTSYGALEVRRDGHNAGFYREKAMLHVVVISDEEDSSSMSPNEYAAWLMALKPDPEQVTFSSIVSPNPVCEGANDPGVEYLAVTDVVGGIVWSVCSPEWDEVLERLGLQAAGMRREFFLSELPVPGTVEVWIVVDGVTLSFEEGVDWVYSPSRNSVAFHEYVPPELAEILIRYEVQAAAEHWVGAE